MPKAEFGIHWGIAQDVIFSKTYPLKSEDISDSHPEELLCRYDDISTWFRITVLGCCRLWPGSPPRFPT